MNHSDIEHMAQGFPPSSIGKDHEEVVTFLATSLLAAQKKLNAAKARAGVTADMNGFVREGFEKVVAERDALAAENGLAAKAVQTFCDVVGSNTDVIAEEMGMEGAKAILAAMSATGNMPATGAYLNAIRAEGIVMFASKQLAATSDLEGTITLERLMLEAEELAGQLRGSHKSAAERKASTE